MKDNSKLWKCKKWDSLWNQKAHIVRILQVKDMKTVKGLVTELKGLCGGSGCLVHDLQSYEVVLFLNSESCCFECLYAIDQIQFLENDMLW